MYVYVDHMMMWKAESRPHWMYGSIRQIGTYAIAGGQSCKALREWKADTSAWPLTRPHRSPPFISDNHLYLAHFLPSSIQYIAEEKSSIAVAAPTPLSILHPGPKANKHKACIFLLFSLFLKKKMERIEMGLPPKIPGGLLMKPGYLSLQDGGRHAPPISSASFGKPNNAMLINDLHNSISASPTAGKTTPMAENLMTHTTTASTKTAATAPSEPSNSNISDVKQEVIGSPSESNGESKSPSEKDAEMDTSMDLKRVKRILANRLSAQRSRIKKMQYIAELEQKASSLQAKIGLLTPQVGYYDNQRLVLTMENNAMKQRISSLMHEKLFKDAQYQVLRRDGERLKELYLQQQQEQQQQQPIMGFSETNQPQSFNVTTDPLGFFFD
ncbi:hypothetical protein ACLOJK_023433 [Asimina triloba]